MPPPKQSTEEKRYAIRDRIAAASGRLEHFLVRHKNEISPTDRAFIRGEVSAMLVYYSRTVADWESVKEARQHSTAAVKGKLKAHCNIDEGTRRELAFLLDALALSIGAEGIPDGEQFHKPGNASSTKIVINVRI